MKKMFKICKLVAIIATVVCVAALATMFVITRSEKSEENDSVWSSYGDWYRPGTNLAECPVYDTHWNYLGSILNDPDLSSNYYWMVPSGMTYQDALNDGHVHAIWEHTKFSDMFGTDFLIGLSDKQMLYSEEFGWIL